MEIQDKLIEATMDIFSSMVMMEITVKEIMTEHGQLQDSITGMIGLAGTHKGVLAVHFPYTVAMAITSSFLMMDVEEINEDVHDAVGEIANMLGGNVKTILSEKGRDIDLSLPSTIAGSQYSFQSDKQIEKVIITFDTGVGTFMVEMDLEK
ncbi:MAG: chemotaxis protein CheX [Desulfocapsa sp.]|uniref:Chemotaxis protein CheX n=1 Tax=Desulfotalea psychrophila TaxID=84980 RepID=A0ABS3AUY8_9BACT|nr:chemotaxis protein CheX [Desulfocapsa sp.]MBN4048743.1 chemotaxis protein CheX [bacterium AH-315-N22]MBN4068583.1 chemotaxis protein CheX [Desulfotalea psychrophila]